ncbi:hypothetical protein LJ725_13020 [Reyranella aquatilis]|uniref:Uncharacterized protein n=1 Tax=Reyranella aquatilis TaxID=2035356 RepID=A0ABS8KUY2_9HYPH|nr:hypothetical protein [Reyranella aquatilis]MCC8429895.1 hypothetical protein [Reyranella aquatilis]
MKFFCRHVCGFIVVALALLGAPRAALAACTSPAGIGGTITWNGTDSVIWCDGTNWYTLKNADASGSAGYIQFSNGSGGFSNSGTTAGEQLFWDNTNKRLGIGTAIVRYPLHVGAGTGALTAYTGNSIDTFTPQIVAQPTSGVAGVGAFVNNGTNNRRAALFMNDTDLLWGLSQANSSGGAVPFVIRQYNTGEVLRIDSSGKVGIGTASPVGRLHVSTGNSGQTTPGANADDIVVESAGNTGLTILSGTTSTGQINFGDSGNAAQGRITYDHSNDSLSVHTNASQALTILSSGNVGIGTTTPSGTLYVKGNTLLSDDTANVTASYPLRVYSASNASGLVNLYYQNADVNGANLSLQKYKSGGNEIAAGDILGSIDFFGTTGAGNSLRAAQIRATAETGWGGTGDAPGRLTFWTTPDGTSTAVERMRIDNAGNVGIGITTPGSALHVSGTDNTAYATSSSAADGPAFLSSPTAPMMMIGNIGNTDGQGAYLSFLTRNSAANGQRAYIGAVSNSAGRAPTIVFGQQTALAAYAERMRISSTGNVGISTTTPAAKLDVNGFMRLAKNGSAPATCDATIDGAIALTSARRMCVCDATSWVEVNSATACTW